DISVAGMYHTAVVAHIGLAESQAGMPRNAEVAIAFEISDRCRGIAADVLRSLDDLPAGPAREAARRWLSAGSAWAAEYEGLVAEVTRDPLNTPSSDELRRRVLATEEELDRAESQVARLAPGLLGGRTGARPGADLAAVQRALGDDAALVMYETFDQDLVVWAVGPRSVPPPWVRGPRRRPGLRRAPLPPHLRDRRPRRRRGGGPGQAPGRSRGRGAAGPAPTVRRAPPGSGAGAVPCPAAG